MFYLSTEFKSDSFLSYILLYDYFKFFGFIINSLLYLLYNDFIILSYTIDLSSFNTSDSDYTFKSLTIASYV